MTSVFDGGYKAEENAIPKVVVVSSQGKLIYPDSEVQPGKKEFDHKSSVSLKHISFKHSRRSKNKLVKTQLIQSANNDPPNRSISIQTDPETLTTCRCKESAISTVASRIGDSRAFSEDEINKFEKFYFKQQSKDEGNPMFAFLIITTMILLSIAVYFLWNAKVPLTEIWSTFPNLPKKRKKEISKFPIFFKIIGKLFDW